MVKNIIIAVVAVIAIAGVYFPTGNGEELAGSTQDDWTIGTSKTSTSTITIENAGTKGGCLKIKQSDGSGYGFFTATPTGNIATTTSC